MNPSNSCPVSTHGSVMCNSPYVFIWLKQRINAVYDPAEEPPIKRLGHGIPHVRGFVHRVRPDNGLAPCHNTVGR